MIINRSNYLMAYINVRTSTKKKNLMDLKRFNLHDETNFYFSGAIYEIRFWVVTKLSDRV